jgi:hypothetical protein
MIFQAAKLEPNHMPARYAIAVHRIRDAVRLQCPDDQLLWAANEMATVLKKETLQQLMPQWLGQGWQWLTGPNMKLLLLMMLSIPIPVMQKNELFIHLNR